MTPAEKKFQNAEKKFNILKKFAEMATEAPSVFYVIADMQMEALKEMADACDELLAESE